MTTTAPQSRGRATRRDAARNRERILAAGRDVFAERGLTATLDDVAERAQLGVGTVYRNFGNRDELIESLFDSRVEEIDALSRRAVADDDPWAGFAALVHDIAHAHVSDRGMREALLAVRHADRRRTAALDRLAPGLEAVVHHAQAAGVLRDDLTGADVPALAAMACGAADHDPDHWERYLNLLLDGLRTTTEEHR